MKAFLMALLLFTGWVVTGQAQQEADTQYLGIYSTLQAAEKLASEGQPREALTAYTEAQLRLGQFQKTYPEWNPSIIKFRLNYLAGKISDLNNRALANNAPVAKPTAPAIPSAENAARMQAQLEDLNAQLASTQAENSSLQAKLKEALATQPAAVDAAELTRAQEQIRDLMKENELLKARHATTGKTGSTDSKTAASDKLQKKLTTEQAHATQLADENEHLRKELKQAGESTTTLAALREENGRLQTQLASLKEAAKTDAAMELKKDRELIASLRTAVANAADEKSALEKKNRELTKGSAASGYEKSIRKLTAERDDLAQQLAAAKQKSSRRSDRAAATAGGSNSDQQVATLRARLAVLEAEKIPFTPEELAQFRQPEPAITATAPAKSASDKLPPGTAELAASAREHFSRHEYVEASADYQKILERDANNAVALANLATIELQQDKLAEAEKHIMAALAQNPNDAYNLSTLGSLKYHQNKYDEALDALSRSAALDPNNPETQNYLGVTLGQKGQRQQAEAAFRRAVRLNPAYAPAHNNLAMIYVNQQPAAPQLARWHYQKALAAGQPHNPELEKTLAEKGAPVDAP
ncbi:MAG: tetratricopeptide repeat protein [Verrucomicrobiota bacterium]